MVSKDIRQARSPISSLSRVVEGRGLSISWLAGDGSDRCYFRMSDSGLNKSWVLMQLGDEDRKALESSQYDWVVLRGILEKAGIRVPQLHHILPKYGEIVIEDCDDNMFEQEIKKLHKEKNQRLIEEVYQKAFAVIARMLKIRKSKRELWCERSFDKNKLSSELHFFVEKYLRNYLQLILTKHENSLLYEDIEKLSKFLASRPQFFVHRDFHSRNIMLGEDELIVIDFQDARLGPCAYDVVSLCYDSYVPLTLDFRQNLMKEAQYFLSKTVDPILDQELTITAEAMLLQRQLKALGSFAFLTLEKQRGDFLQYRHSAFETLSGAFDKRWPFLSGLMLEKIQNTR